MSDIESDPQFTVLLDDLEASGAENSDSYSDISVTSVYTCDLTDFDKDSSDSDNDKCAESKCQLESRWFVIAVVWDLRSVEFHTLKTKLFCRFSLFLFVLRNLSSNAQLCFFVVVVVFFVYGYTSPKFHWSRSNANFTHTPMKCKTLLLTAAY